MKKNMLLGAAALLAVFAALFIFISFRWERPSTEPGGGKPKVIATIFPQYDFARAVGGGNIELSLLLKPGTDSHSYSPSPQDIIRIQNCDIFMYIGGKDDHWADKILDSFGSGKRPHVVKLIDAVTPVKDKHVEGMQEDHAHGHEHDEEHEHEDEKHDHAKDPEKHEHEHGHYDEHIWTSPKNAEKMAAAIKDALISADPKNRAAYEENFKKYSAELKRLDGDIRRMVDASRRRKILFADRFPFRYMTDEYGLDYSAAFPGCAAESEASAATVAYLIDVVKKENIPVVFHIEMSNEKTADTICRETGAKKLMLHSCHNLSKDEIKNNETYITLMRNNLKNLREALN
ncbi:MAG: metal ABC transporter substrate-binding protein [Synergistes sp.]|nr:metal ABC transporter substrate-binding protein [Synergistes sp.]